MTDMQNCLPGHPANGRLPVDLLLDPEVVGDGRQTPGQSEVGDLDEESVTNEALATGERTVDETQRLQVTHRRRYLRRQIDQAPVTTAHDVRDAKVI